MLFFIFVVLPVVFCWLMVKGEPVKPPRIYLEDPNTGEVISFRAERVLTRQKTLNGRGH